MAIAAVQVSFCLLYFKVLRNTFLERDLERGRSLLPLLFQLFRRIVSNADKYCSLLTLTLIPRIIFFVSYIYTNNIFTCKVKPTKKFSQSAGGGGRWSSSFHLFILQSSARHVLRLQMPDSGFRCEATSDPEIADSTYVT